MRCSQAVVRDGACTARQPLGLRTIASPKERDPELEEEEEENEEPRHRAVQMRRKGEAKYGRVLAIDQRDSERERESYHTTNMLFTFSPRNNVFCYESNQAKWPSPSFYLPLARPEVISLTRPEPIDRTPP